MSHCNIEVEANQVFQDLLAGEDITIPSINLDDPSFQLPGGINNPIFKTISPLTNDQLSTLEADGTGTFDYMMRAMMAHMMGSYKDGNLTKGEMIDVLKAGIVAALGNSVQFLLGRDQAHWQALRAQVEAVTANVQLATARMQLAVATMEANTQRANFARAKAGLATDSMNYCGAKFNVEQMLPQQLINAQEQGEAQRAQTSNTRSDGSTVAGLIGKQKDLYTQQITSYQRDIEIKAAKIWTDAWTVMKTMDDGLLPPNQFANTNIDSILLTVKTNNELGV
ncbi:virion structural protein [Stenotrophomonas phage Philippe]|uniref:Uncharacterized protein n=1 Tax=Stenotrophomonas phage Philippe TaxID=2859655 RepID=A0AAE8BI47_9CAUD|nr:virion structural protein [Stenotrophomonas phage Philippe]QYW02274.1 hypothetical protein CPT_Philippe_081 [Stenotrophomonas phage Philippe]